jgi:DNA helicase-2/ATP-dependent DNA helicase PcrA
VKYTAGERVRHKVFGEGLVLKVEDMPGDSLLEIAFDNVGTKKIMANFAKIDKC